MQSDCLLVTKVTGYCYKWWQQPWPHDMAGNAHIAVWQMGGLYTSYQGHYRSLLLLIITDFMRDYITDFGLQLIRLINNTYIYHIWGFVIEKRTVKCKRSKLKHREGGTIIKCWLDLIYLWYPTKYLVWDESLPPPPLPITVFIVVVVVVIVGVV